MTQVAALPAPLEFTATLPVVVGHGDMVEGAGVGAWRLRDPVSIPREAEMPVGGGRGACCFEGLCGP